MLSAAARLRHVRGDHDQARTQASEVLSLSRQLEDSRGVAWSFEIFAGVCAAESCTQSAAQLWGASDMLLDSVGAALSPEIRWVRDGYLLSVKHALGPKPFARAYDHGRQMSFERAIALTHQAEDPPPRDRNRKL